MHTICACDVQTRHIAFVQVVKQAGALGPAQHGVETCVSEMMVTTAPTWCPSKLAKTTPSRAGGCKALCARAQS